jgi:two-component system nitrogen regulation response regulator NtrX
MDMHPVGGSMKSVLVVDDERSVRDSITMILEYEKFVVQTAENGPASVEKVESGDFDLVLLDIKMPGEDGLKILRRLRQSHPDLPVVMISGHGTIETAVEATRLGAYDFLQKPLDREKLLIVVRNATEQHRLISEYRQMKEAVEGKDVILGGSPKIKEVLAAIERVAPTDVRVLITGENGTGKELVAKAIHRRSKRNAKALVEVNCAAIPNELIESELFGHERGAFTGAVGQRTGKFELADGGTLFLDEIGDMSLNAQAKVLRALEEGKIERVGGIKQIPVDVRVIAATNKNLAEQIRQNAFREDLYHRLSVIPIRVPPLRERREDIPLLATAFADEICRRNGIPVKRFSGEALRVLQTMEWSGNVRELRNTVERMVIMSAGDVIEASILEPAGTGGKNAWDDLLSRGGSFQEFKDRAEAAFIKKQLERYSWNISRTAEALGIQRSHLYNKIRKYDLEREGGGD